jgi:phosphohistidine phosphatase
MQVWLIRHAVAAEREEFNGPDEARPLTAKGERQFRSFIDWLVEQTTTPSVIVTSPLVRAAQTAEIARKGLGLKKKDVSESQILSPGAEPQALVELARQSSPSIVSTVALVGHEPDLSRAVSAFIGGGEIAFGKGFVAAIDFPEEPALGAGRLCWFVGPKLKSG